MVRGCHKPPASFSNLYPVSKSCTLKIGSGYLVPTMNRDKLIFILSSGKPFFINYGNPDFYSRRQWTYGPTYCLSKDTWNTSIKQLKSAFFKQNCFKKAEKLSKTAVEGI